MTVPKYISVFLGILGQFDGPVVNDWILANYHLLPTSAQEDQNRYTG